MKDKHPGEIGRLWRAPYARPDTFDGVINGQRVIVLREPQDDPQQGPVWRVLLRIEHPGQAPK